MSPLVVVAIVVVDIAITAAVLGVVISRRGGLTAMLASVKGLASAAGDLQREIREYVRANWSGDPSSLPAVVEPLLAKLTADMAARGLPVDRARLLPFVTQVIVRENIADERAVREALKRVA